MDMPEKCPPILYELMSGCWQYDHRHRPTFVEVVERFVIFTILFYDFYTRLFSLSIVDFVIFSGCHHT